MKRRHLSAIILLVLLLGAGAYVLVRSNANPARAAPPPRPAAQPGGTTSLVSIHSNGTQANDHGGYYGVSISEDGRHVAFQSQADNLVDDDTNDCADVFIHDRVTHQTARVSVASNGTQGDNVSGYHRGLSISADGRYVAFVSWANNLVLPDTTPCGEVYLHDRDADEDGIFDEQGPGERSTTRVSVHSDGTQGTCQSIGPGVSISADGRYVAFASSAGDLVDDDTNGKEDVFVHDRVTGQTTRVSVHSLGTQGNRPSFGPSISTDGRYVAFVSWGDDLVDLDSNDHEDVLVHDRDTGQTTLVSVHSDGSQANAGTTAVVGPSISADGRYVAFFSPASNLVDDDTNACSDVFLHDRVTGRTTRVSIASDRTEANARSWSVFISANGRYVAFGSQATNLVASDTNGNQDVFVHDRVTGQTTLVSVASDDAQGNDDSGTHGTSISADGRYVAFSSLATNLVDPETNGYHHVFVRDRGVVLQLPFNASDQAGPCSSSQNGRNCINSFLDHHYPTASSSGDGIMQRFFGDPLNVSGGCTLGVSCYDEHNGYDFQLRPASDPDNPPAGSLVRAAASGTVTDISQADVCDSSHWRGTALRIDHDGGYSTEYWHLSRNLVTSGHVDAGTPIGVVGNTGCTRGTTGTHLHFGTYYGGHVVDPYGWCGPGSDPYVAVGHGTSLWTAGSCAQGLATSATGGSVATQSGDMSVAAPPGAVTDTTLLQLALTPDPVAEPSAVPAWHSFALSAKDMSGNPVVDFSQPLTLEVTYSDTDITYLLENTLSVYSWDDLTSAWLPISTVLDLVNNKATANITHLSLFTLMGDPQNPAPTVTSVSPNSGYSHLDTEITIEGTGFLPTPSVRLGLNELAVTFVDSTTLTAVVPSGLDPGAHDLTVTNPDAQEGTLESAFTVQGPLKVYLPLIFKNY